MLQSLLPLLKCPVTRTDLTVKVIKSTDKIFNGNTVSIIEEALLFAEADWVYPVISGIPRLNVEAFLDYEIFLKQHDDAYFLRKANLIHKYANLIKYVTKKNRRTKESFTKEWGIYNYESDKTWDADNEAMVVRFLKETDETAETLKDKFIFDAGCGNGKLDILLADKCANIIAMDFADCIANAYKRNDFLNVHFIQGDIQFPPLQFNYFDIVHSSGVLIHTNNPELSFSCMEPTVKKTGKLSIWLYHPRKDFIHNLINMVRRVTSKLPLGLQYYLYAVTIFPVSYCIKKIKGNKQNAREMMLSVLDWFTPEFRSEHEHTEAAAWFYKRGYKNIRVTTNDIFGFNIIGEK